MTLTDPDCPHSVREKLAAKADRIADIIERNNFRQNEKVEDAKQIALELARDLRALSVRDQINGGVTQEARAELEALREYAREATKAITSLTAGGSEYFAGRIGEIYVADLPFCLERIRASKHALHKQLTAAQAEREQLEARVKELEADFMRRDTDATERGQALLHIIDRCENGELGTSKVNDVRRIAEEAMEQRP